MYHALNSVCDRCSTRHLINLLEVVLWVTSSLPAPTCLFAMMRYASHYDLHTMAPTWCLNGMLNISCLTLTAGESQCPLTGWSQRTWKCPLQMLLLVYLLTRQKHPTHPQHLPSLPHPSHPWHPILLLTSRLGPLLEWLIQANGFIGPSASPHMSRDKVTGRGVL